ncbi:MAG: pyridoxal-phosphate dependent enzyme [bacterium]
MTGLFDRYPRLRATLPLVSLGVSETPVERWTIDGATLLIKRDDLSAPAMGGNKVRALELLLAGVRTGGRVLTVGPTGSTHALAVAHYTRQLGAEAEVITWPQETNAVAIATARRLATRAAVTPSRSTVGAYFRAAMRRRQLAVRWVAAGGSSPRGALGHASAALELVRQLGAEGRPMPAYIVVPLGSGGTVAGLLLGLAIAGARTRVVAVRVVPGIVGNRWHVLRLAARSGALLARLAGEAVPRLDPDRLVIAADAYGGAYGRSTGPGRAAAVALLAAGGPPLDDTYSAKAFGHALALARGAPDDSVLFWLTFDGRWLAAGDDSIVPLPR